MRFPRCSWSSRLGPLLALAVLMFVAPVAAADAPADEAAKNPKGLELFDTQVGALLEQHCLKCHGGDKTQGEFDLTTRDGLAPRRQRWRGDRGRAMRSRACSIS